jgi:hypothetical protein
MDQEWFEMVDIRRRKLNNAVWIPLRASQTLEATVERGHIGHREEFFGAGSIAVPLEKRTSADTLGWTDIGLRRTHKGGIQDRCYVAADVVDGYELKLGAVALVLEQEGNADDPTEWHLHQDFVITLKLKRERDTWLAMDEGYVEVAHLRRHNGRPILLEVRAEHLKDYLCARGMALYVSTYRNREETVNDAGHINWPENPFRQISDGDRWEGRRTEIHEGGYPFGSSVAVLHMGREGIDFQEDVPVIGPSDENVVSKSWIIQRKGEKLIRIHGELWRNEWVEPGDHSPRIRGDKLPPSAFFITDTKGTRCSAEGLEGTGGWLWFRPEVMVALSHRRGGGLRWYTRDTGGVKCSPTNSYLPFGVNKLGLVNVFAKDVGFLPEWIQTFWAAYNVGPEGGVSEELLAAQAEGWPADTQAPEELLPKALDLLNEKANKKFGFDLFRAHEQYETLIAGAHRFRSTDRAAFFSLAKDLARLTADRIDVSAVQKIVAPPKGEKWGSLKSLENLAALTAGSAEARLLIGPLAGIYELRHADAHLASGDIEDALALAKVDRDTPFVFQGYQLLHSCVSALYSIAKALDEFPDSSH